MTFPNRLMNLSMVCFAIPINESVFNRFGFTGSIVPIASYLMVRSDFYNGAHNEICSWANFLSLYWLEALIFFVLGTDSFYFLRIRINALLHCFLFYEMTHRPYILYGIFYHWFYFFLPFFHPSIYPHLSSLFRFTTWNRRRIRFLFLLFVYAKNLSVATVIWSIYHILTGSLDPDNAKWWVGH